MNRGEVFRKTGNSTWEYLRLQKEIVEMFKLETTSRLFLLLTISEFELKAPGQ